jgi:hypothetical protein
MIILVTFGSAKEYAYFTDIEDLKVDDKVIVPVGKNNEEKEVIVTKINATGEEARFATKKIIRRA